MARTYTRQTSTLGQANAFLREKKLTNVTKIKAAALKLGYWNLKPLVPKLCYS